MTHKKNDPAYYHNYYLAHKVEIQLRNEKWLERHPGYRKANNRKNYLLRKAKRLASAPE